jgi:hypothetical protein
MLRTGDFIPFAAPSTAAFGENSPKGRCMDAARCQRAKDGPSGNPRRKRGAQGKSGNGRPFLWLLSFGRAKESNSPSGARTRLKQSVALATLC